MDPRLQAGVELQLEKQAQQEHDSSLSGVLGQHFKQAAAPLGPGLARGAAAARGWDGTLSSMKPILSEAFGTRRGDIDPSFGSITTFRDKLDDWKDTMPRRAPDSRGQSPHEFQHSFTQASPEAIASGRARDIDPRRKGPQGRFPDTENNQPAPHFLQAAPGLAAKTGPSPLRRAWDWASARHPVYQAGKGAIEGAVREGGKSARLLRSDIMRFLDQRRQAAAAKSQAQFDAEAQQRGYSAPLAPGEIRRGAFNPGEFPTGQTGRHNESYLSRQ